LGVLRFLGSMRHGRMSLVQIPPKCIVRLSFMAGYNDLASASIERLVQRCSMEQRELSRLTFVFFCLPGPAHSFQARELPCAIAVLLFLPTS
jgi:hypothetical protein